MSEETLEEMDEFLNQLVQARFEKFLKFGGIIEIYRTFIVARQGFC